MRKCIPMLGFCTNKSNICISFVPKLIEAEPNQILLYKLMVLSDAKIMTFFCVIFRFFSITEEKNIAPFISFSRQLFSSSQCVRNCVMERMPHYYIVIVTQPKVSQLTHPQRNIY